MQTQYTDLETPLLKVFSLQRQSIASALFPQASKNSLIDQDLLMEVRRKRKTQVQTIDLDEVGNKDEVPWKSCRSMENSWRLPSSIYIQICMAVKAATFRNPTVTSMCRTAGIISKALHNKRGSHSPHLADEQTEAQGREENLSKVTDVSQLWWDMFAVLALER